MPATASATRNAGGCGAFSMPNMYALSKPEKRFQHNLMLTVYNAYGRHNPFEQNFNKIMDDNGNIVVPVNLEGDIERIPTSVSVAGAIPSLNYTFRF